METRTDTYLWSIRIFKTRTQAAKAIAEGKVKLNGNDCKASHIVKIGEVFSIKTSDKRQSIQVASIINKRVQYTEAIIHYFDVSTAEEKEYLTNKMSSSFYTGKRLSKQGRPTKKNARDIQDFINPDNSNEPE